MECCPSEQRLTGRGIMNKLFGSLAVAIVAAGLTAVAQDTPKQEIKKAGSDVKEAGKATGGAVKHTGKAVAKGTKKGVHKAAAATEKGADKVKDKTKQ
jgi:hypothetical protein